MMGLTLHTQGLLLDAAVERGGPVKEIADTSKRYAPKMAGVLASVLRESVSA